MQTNQELKFLAKSSSLLNQIKQYL